MNGAIHAQALLPCIALHDAFRQHHGQAIVLDWKSKKLCLSRQESEFL
jgi:hypothetical protein